MIYVYCTFSHAIFTVFRSSRTLALETSFGFRQWLQTAFFFNSESSHFKPVLISTHQSLIMELLREYLQLYCMVCSVQRIPSGQPSVVAPGWPACWSGVCSLSASCPPTLSSRPSDEAMFLYLLHTPTIKFIFSSCYPWFTDFNYACQFKLGLYLRE